MRMLCAIVFWLSLAIASLGALRFDCRLLNATAETLTIRHRDGDRNFDLKPGEEREFVLPAGGAYLPIDFRHHTMFYRVQLPPIKYRKARLFKQTFRAVMCDDSFVYIVPFEVDDVRAAVRELPQPEGWPMKPEEIEAEPGATDNPDDAQ